MSAIVRLDDNQLNKSLGIILSSASGLPDVSAISIANTLSKVYSSGASNKNTSVSLVPSHLILLPYAVFPPSLQIQEHLRDLILSAHEGANDLCCGSILAGQGSETDEYGDIGFWLGDGPYGDNPPEVLNAIGLECFGGDKASASTIGRISLTPTGLPESLWPPPPDPSLSKLKDLLSALDNKYAFFVKGGSFAGGVVLHVLLGEVKFGEEHGWGGILSIGIWTDN